MYGSSHTEIANETGVNGAGRPLAVDNIAILAHIEPEFLKSLDRL